MAKKKIEQERVVYRVAYNSELQCWQIKSGDHIAGNVTPKIEAVKLAKEWAKKVHSKGGLSQVVVHKRNGQFEKEFIYGAGPVRTKG